MKSLLPFSLLSWAPCSQLLGPRSPRKLQRPACTASSAANFGPMASARSSVFPPMAALRVIMRAKAALALQEAGVVLSCFVRFGGAAFCLMQAADTIKCVGPSMLPTLNRDGDIVLLDKLSPRLWRLRPGEVVIARSVSNPRQTVCKRIVAQEGDTVCVKPRYSSSEVEFHKIPKGHVWLEGDNKHDSHDSRYYGPVPYSMLQGRVVMRIWPLNQCKWMKKEVSPQAFRER